MLQVPCWVYGMDAGISLIPTTAEETILGLRKHIWQKYSHFFNELDNDDLHLWMVSTLSSFILGS